MIRKFFQLRKIGRTSRRPQSGGAQFDWVNAAFILAIATLSDQIAPTPSVAGPEPIVGVIKPNSALAKTGELKTMRLTENGDSVLAGVAPTSGSLEDLVEKEISQADSSPRAKNSKPRRETPSARSEEKVIRFNSKTESIPVKSEDKPPKTKAQKKVSSDDISIESKDSSIEIKETPIRKTKLNRESTLSREEQEFLKTIDESKSGEAGNIRDTYVPAPVEVSGYYEGVKIDRDSSKVMTVRLSIKDSMTLRLCFSAGLSILLDDDVDTDLQRVLIDDRIFFDAQEFENKRGVYVRLKQPIPENSTWESALHLVRKKDDKEYLINLIAVSQGSPGCPKTGTVKFPKVIYIKDKSSALTANAKVLTPEDAIIEYSEGLPRLNRNNIFVYDILASAGSEYTVFGVEVTYPEVRKLEAGKPKFIVLDHLQVNKLNATATHLQLQSKTASEKKGQVVERYNISIEINKSYVVNRRYLHIMYVDPSYNHYQYIRLDTLKLFLSLKKRGFDI